MFFEKSSILRLTNNSGLSRCITVIFGTAFWGTNEQMRIEYVSIFLDRLLANIANFSPVMAQHTEAGVDALRNYCLLDGLKEIAA